MQPGAYQPRVRKVQETGAADKAVDKNIYKVEEVNGWLSTSKSAQGISPLSDSLLQPEAYKQHLCKRLAVALE